MIGKRSVIANKRDNKGILNMELTSPTRMGYLLLAGFGEITATYPDPLNLAGKMKETRCRCNGHFLCPLWNFNGVPLPETLLISIKIDVFIYFQNMRDEFEVVLMGGDVIELKYPDHVHFSFDSVPNLDFIYRIESLPAEDRGKTRVQFTAKHTAEAWMDYSESIKMIVKGGEYLLQGETTNVKSSTIGLGVMTTIQQNDFDFCVSDGCLYSLRFESLNATGVVLHMLLSNLTQTISVYGGYLGIDQIRAGEVIRYEMISMYPGPKDWNFYLTPIEGNPGIYVHEKSNNIPAKLEDYRWTTDEDSIEVVTIHKEEIKRLNITGDRFIVAITSQKNATFALQADSYELPDAQSILINVPYTGEIFPDEITNYIVHLVAHDPETYNMKIQLKALTGNPDLYIKECLLENDLQNCIVTKEDIKNKVSLQSDPGRYFKYSSLTSSDDEVPLEFNCLPMNWAGVPIENIIAAFNNTLPFSRTCAFTIAVHGQSSLANSVSKYRLIVKGRNHHETFSPNTINNFKVSPHEEVFYVGNIQYLTEGTKTLLFEFHFVSGDGEVFISRSNSAPGPDSYDKKTTLDNDNTNLYSKTKRIVFTADNADELQGKYYVRLSAREFVFGSWSLTTHNVKLNGSDVENLPINDSKSEVIYFDQMVVGEMKSNQFKRYYFELNSTNVTDPINPDNELEVVVHITSLVGKARFCVVPGTEIVNSKNDCILYSVASHLTIDSSSTKYIKNGKYGILVFSGFNDKTEEGTSQIVFSLSVNSHEFETTLYPGIPKRLSGNFDKRHFKIPFDPSVNFGYLVIESTDPEMEVHLQFKSKYDEDTNLTTTETVGFRTIYEFNKTHFIDCCEGARQLGREAELKLLVSSDVFSTVTILPVFGNTNILVEDGMGFSLPSPLSNSTVFSFTPSVRTQASTVTISSSIYDLSVKVDVSDGNQPPTKTFISSGRQMTSVHISRNYIALLRNPIIRTTISNIDASIFKDFEKSVGLPEFDYEFALDVQLSSGVSELIPSVTQTHLGRDGTCSFFIVRKFAWVSGYVSVANVLSGSAMIYMKKGINVYADPKDYDIKASSLNSGFISLPATRNSTDDNEQDFGSSTLEEYSIAVCTSSQTKFDIVFLTNVQAMIINLAPGEVFKKVLPANQTVIIHYMTKSVETTTVVVKGDNSRVPIYYRLGSKTDYSPNLVNSFAKEKSEEPWFTTNSPGIPDFQDLPSSPTSMHHLFKLQLENTDMVTLFIASSRQSVQISLVQDSPLSDRLISKNIRHYKLTSNNFHNQLTAKIKLYYGSLLVTAQNSLKKDAKGSVSKKITASSGSSQGFVTDTISIMGALEDESQISEDGEIRSGKSSIFFKTGFITVEADRDSMYDIEYISDEQAVREGRTNKTYTQIFQGEKTKLATGNYFYYIPSSKIISKLKVTFTILADKKRLGKINANADTTIVNNVKFYFLNVEGFGALDRETGVPKVAAEIKDYKSIQQGDAKTTVSLVLTALKGYLVMEIPQSLLSNLGTALSGTMLLSINNFRSIAVNTFMMDSVRGEDFDNFQVYIPGPGKLWVDVEDCTGELVIQGGKSLADIEGYKIQSSLHEGTVVIFNAPGMYFISVKRKSQSMIPEVFYILRTQFMDIAKGTFLSSYILDLNKGNVIPEDNVKIEAVNGISKFVNAKVKVSTPDPKVSLALDYPEIKKIIVTISAVLVPAQNILLEQILNKNKCKDTDYLRLNPEIKSGDSGLSGQSLVASTEFTVLKKKNLDTEFDWTEVSSSLKSLSVPISTTLDRQKDQSVSLVLNVGYTFFGQDDDFEGDDYKIQTVYTKKLIIPKNKIVQPPIDNKPEEPVKPKEESKPELIPNDPKPKTEEPTDSSSTLKLIVVAVCIIVVLVIAVYLLRRKILLGRRDESIQWESRPSAEVGSVSSSSSNTKEIPTVVANKLDISNDSDL